METLRSRCLVVASLDRLRQIGHRCGGSGTCHFYRWFFGYVAKLPYEREIPAGDDMSHYLDAATSIP